MKPATAHNLSVIALLEALSDVPQDCRYVDAIVADELTLKFRPSAYQGSKEPPEETDINQLIG